MSGTYYRRGENWSCCPVCGNEYRASAFRKRWDGLWVCAEDYEERHPQDLLRVTPDDMRPAVVAGPKDDIDLLPLPPDCPVMLTPSDGVVMDGASIYISWLASPRATYYEVRVYPVGDPMPPPIIVTDTEYTATDLLREVAYNVKVNAANQNGRSSTAIATSGQGIPGCEFVSATTGPDIDAQLSGLSWVLPCSNNNLHFCECPQTVSDSATMIATEGTSYDVTFRVRGVLELLKYTGGTQLEPSYFYKNKTGQTENTVNIYRLSVSSPAVDYYINMGTFNVSTLVPIDYEVTIQIDEGATVTLFADSKDGGEVNNDSTPQSVADDDPDHPIVVAMPYDGQFAQIDVVSVVKR